LRGPRRKVSRIGQPFEGDGRSQGLRDAAHAGFVDFVVARGLELHRTAVLLTRDGAARCPPLICPSWLASATTTYPLVIYGSVPWQDYPFPPRPADLDTNPEYAWGGGAGNVRVLGPTTTQEANKPLTFTRPFDPNLSLNLQVRGPGRMKVLTNGKDISEPMNSQQTPDKLLAFWGYEPGACRGVRQGARARGRSRSRCSRWR